MDVYYDAVREGSAITTAPKSVALSGWRRAVAKLLGIAANQPEPWENQSAYFGNHLSPPPQSITRWYLADLEKAIFEADTGDLSRFAKLCRALSRDGTVAGVLGTRTGGLVRLKKTFTGDPAMVAALEGDNGQQGIFDLMFPKPELASLVEDGIKMRVGVGELLPVEGREFPVFRRLNPEFLLYRWNENRWYYRSLHGMLPITPGDGRWILHLPSGESEPWANAVGWALGRSFISKDHAYHLRSNYEQKLANPARVAYSPQGASDGERRGFLQKLIAWGVNSVFALLPGWDIKLLESNGRGYEVFKETIAKCDEEMITALGSSPVLVTGGSGFANADIHKSIRADAIQNDAEGLAHTINTQGIPPWVNAFYGAAALSRAPKVAWDVTPPKDLKAEAESLEALGRALIGLNSALVPYNKRADEERLCIRFGVPIDGDKDGDAQPESAKSTATTEASMASADTDIDTSDLLRLVDLAKTGGLRPTKESLTQVLQRHGLEVEPVPAMAESSARIVLAPTDAAKVVRGREARASMGLPPFGDNRDDMLIPDLAQQDTGENEAQT